MFNQDLLRDIQKKGVSFDVETGGFYRGQNMYSATFAKWGATKPDSYFFDVSKDVKKFSYFGKKGWKELIKDGPPQFTTHKAFIDVFAKTIQENDYIVGHNLRFDFDWMYEYADKNQRNTINTRLWGKDWKNNKYVQNKFRPVDGRVNYNLRRGRFTEAYGAYTNYIKEAKAAGTAAVIDTLPISKMFAGMAYESGLVGSDIKSGHRLEFLTEALGIGNAGKAHTDMDPLFNQSVAEAFMNGDFDKLESAASESARIGKPKYAPNSIQARRFRENMSGDGNNILNALEHVYTNFGERLSKDFVEKELLMGIAYHNRDKKVPVKTNTGRRVVSRDTSKSLDNLHKTYSKRWDMPVEEVQAKWNELYAQHGNKSFEQIDAYATEKGSIITSKIRQSIKENLKPKINPNINPEKNIFSHANSGSNLKKGLLIAGGIVAASTLFSLASGGYDAPPPTRISSNDDDYNTIEGLHVGSGPRSVAAANIKSDTDFGSGWKSKAGTVAFGFMAGALTSDKDDKSSIGMAALSMTDDVAIFAATRMKLKSSNSESLLNTAIKVLEHPVVQYANLAFGGYAVGKFLGPRIPSFDDAYNSIEGLFHGGVAEINRRRLTDFGSGYQGPNPQLSPEYNDAKDVYRYEAMRASKIGLSEEDMYKYMTEDDSNQYTSEYVQASAHAGTALHEYLGSLDARRGAEDIEEYIEDTQHSISGHIDIIKNGMVGDYKTVSPGIFKAIAKAGKPKDMHYDQVTFYLGQKGMDKGFIQYINRENIRQQKVYTVNFNRRHYEELISKVERTRARVMEDITSGRLDESDLPKTASLERLREAAEERDTVEDMAQKLDTHRLTFNEEMSYLRSVKRGMPTHGQGAERIRQARERRKNESTQGIGISAWNNRNKHQYM